MSVDDDGGLPFPSCDFCGASLADPATESWSYPAADFDGRFSGLTDVGSVVIEALTHRVTGDWFACATCHEIVERGDPDELARRSTGGDPDPLLHMAIRSFQDAFRETRTGPAVRRGH